MSLKSKFFFGLFMGIIAFWAQLVSAATPGQVVINEFITNPSTGQEWYELINTTTSPIDLSGFKIDRTITGDSMSLSGTLPAGGILVFSTNSTAVNDAGDAIILKDASNTVISAVSYGTQNYVGYPHLTSAPGSNQSGYVSNTDLTNPVYSISIPTKGWFNNATDWTCEQLNGQGIIPTTNPTLNSIASCLSSQAILTNLNGFNDPSNAIELFFERRSDFTDATSVIGRIEFNNAINLTGTNTLNYLKLLGSKVNISKDDRIVFIGLDGADSTIFGAINATITMYSLDGQSSVPSIVVRSDDGTIINSGDANFPTIFGQSFDVNTHTFNFSTDGFTSFEVKRSIFTAAIEYSKDGGITYSSSVSAKQGDTLRIRATFNDDVADAPIPQLTISDGVLAATNMTRIDERHYYFDLTVPAGNVVPTVTLGLANNVIGDVIETTPTSGGSFSINNAVPSAPTITQIGNTGNYINDTNKATVHVTGTAEADSLVSVVLTDGSANSTTAQTQQLSGGATAFDITVDTSALVDGTITPAVTATNAVGTSSIPTNVPTASKDTVVPSAPTITQIGNTGNYINDTNKATVHVTGTAEADSLVSVVLTDGSANSTTAQTQQLSGGATAFDITVDASALVDGTITPAVTAADQMGNISVFATTPTASKNVVAPTANIEYSRNGGSTYSASISVKSGDTLRIRATFSEDLSLTPLPQIAIDNELLSATNMVRTDATHYYYDFAVPTGDLTPNVSLSTGIGVISGNPVNPTPASGNSFVIDNTVPAAPTITQIGNAGNYINNVNKATVHVTGIAEADSLVSVTLVDSVYHISSTVTQQLSGGATSFDIVIDASALTDGNIIPSVFARDSAGNTGSSTTTPIAVKNTAAPSAPTITQIGNAGNYINNTIEDAVHVIGTAQANALVSVTLVDSVYSVSSTVTQQLSGGATSFDIIIDASTLADGIITPSVKATDSFGNTSSATTVPTATKNVTGPIASIEYSKDGGDTYSSTINVKGGDTLRIRATFNENVATSPVMQLVIDNSLLAATNMTRVDATHYYYDFTVPSVNLTPSVSLATGTDTEGNIVIATPTSGATFNIDSTAPSAPTITQIGNAGNYINDTNKTTVHVTGTAEADSLVSVVLTDGSANSTTAQTQQLSGGATAFDITVDASALVDGIITPSVTAADSVGNVSNAVATPTGKKDVVAPSVTKLGDGSTDFGILADDNASLVFNEVIDNTSKDSVRTALTNGANNAITFSWPGKNLIVFAGSTDVTFDNDVIVASITDLAGNTTNDVLLIDSVLAINQTAPDEGGSATSSPSTPEVVLTNPTQSVDVNVDASTTNPTLNIDSFVNNGTGTLPQIDITANNAAGTTVSIPSGTTVTSSDPNWDGVLQTPRLSDDQPADGLAIEVGVPGMTLTFDTAVRMVLPGQAGKRLTYSTDGGATYILVPLCSGPDTQATGDALPAGGSCKLNVGSDLILWTKHFTEYRADVNVGALEAALTEAQTKYDEAEEGTNPGQYAVGSKAILLSAINDANAVYNDLESTQVQIDNATTALNNAIDTFDAQMVPVVLQSIEITHAANKLVYGVGDSLDITGLVVTGHYNDESSRTETITTGNITGFDSSAAVTGQVLTITVGSQTTSYTINVVIVQATSITVSGEGSATTITTDNGTLQMHAEFLPTNTTNKGVTWSSIDGTGAATIDSAGLLTAVSNGTVTVRATAQDGSAVFGELVITISNQTVPSVSVTTINVTGEGSATTIETDNGTLQMSAEVLPANATNKAVTWSVVPGTGTASINTSGLLTAVTNGTVTVRATAQDGSGIVGELVITISNQTGTPSSDATVTSGSYTVNSDANTITNVANATDVATFKTNLTPATGATFEVYETDGTTVRIGNVITGDKVIVTAEDTTTTKTYVVTVNAAGDLTGVGVDVANGNITNTAITMQYSLDSSDGTNGTWTDATATNTAVTFIAGPVYIREKANTSNWRLVATIAAPAAAPTLTSDDDLNTITGLDNTFEYKIDEGAWTSGEIAGDFSGTKTVLVRVKATANAFASQNQTISFTTNPSSNATVTSGSYAVDSDANTITNVANATDVATFKANLTAATGATFEVYETDGTTVRVGNVITGDKIIVTAQDTTTTKTYTITVNAGLFNSTVEATKSYDKNGGTTLDILTTFNGNTLTGINDGSRDLVLTTDYTVDGDSITLTQTYMQSLSVGTTTLTFDFSAGANDTTEITVTDSTPSSNATVTSTSYTVDSDANTITNVANATDVATFKANLTPATGATFEVYESDGTTVRVGNINPGDKVIVIAEDTVTTKTYSVGVDSVFPIVAKLGDGSTDFTIAQSGSVDLVFNEPIRSASRTLVENALTNGADRAITFSWNAQGDTLTITGNATGITTFANDVIVASITDMAGNVSSEVLLVDSVIETGQVAPVGGSVVINTTTPQAVISNPVEAVNVTITDGTNTTLDVNSLINDGTGILPQITITANNAGNTVINIPANTTITSSSAAWNGLISTPQVTSASFPNEVVGLAIQVGSSGNTLTFDKGVRILLPGQAGKRIKFTTDGTTYNEVTNVCSADNQTTGDALAAGSDCKIDVGSDLVIWTKHFTTFITFTPTYSGGGGGGAPGAVISPQQVTNKPQTQKPSEPTKPTIPTQELTDAEIITLVENLSQGSAVKNKVLNSLAYNLKYGESGLAIKILQQMLIKYKFLSSEYVAQGYFDQDTATAVRQYKKAYVDSILSIEQVNLIARKIAEIDIKSNAILRSLVDQTRYDERSVKVKIMQEVLKVYGLFPRNIESTGYYDGYTTLAVEAYNLTYSSSSATSDQISSLAKKIAEMKLRDNQILISFMDSTFYGEKSTRVKIMQEVLKNYGFFPKEIPSTGYYNGYTSSAIKKASEFMALNKKYLAMSFSGS